MDTAARDKRIIRNGDVCPYVPGYVATPCPIPARIPSWKCPPKPPRGPFANGSGGSYGDYALVGHPGGGCRRSGVSNPAFRCWGGVGVGVESARLIVCV